MITLQVTVGDRDLTFRDPVTFSNSDPGGFEVCQIDPQDVRGIRPGAPVFVRYGQEIAWHGRLNEPGRHSQGDRDTNALACLGFAAALKDNPYQEIYCDRDYSRWASPSVQRKLNLISGSSAGLQDPTTVADKTTGMPSVQTGGLGDWPATARLWSEAIYDANGISLGSLYYAWTKNANVANADTNWTWQAFLSSDDVSTATDTSGNLRAAGPGSGTVTSTGARKFAGVQFFYAASAAGTQNTEYDIFWQPAVYGTHGLAGRGSSPVGFYPSDIAANALARSKSGIAAGVIETASGLIVPHLTYLTPTPADQIIDQMANLMAWHWGVWEPQTTLDTQPTLHFRSPPSDATAVIGRSECLELDQPKVRLDLLYDTAKVSYTDPAGTRGTVTVTVTNPLLSECGLPSGRTLTLDMGTGTSATAQTFGTFALVLSQRTARGGGYAVVADTVGLPGGGRRPACLLRSGRDRLRITDLPDAGPLHETDTRRFDTFHVRRVESSEQPDGSTQTRIDFDGGTDLMEVLNARFGVQVPLG